MPPPAVLLCGARRAGKCATVAVVARALGCHLLELNAFQLVGDTEVWCRTVRNMHGVGIGCWGKSNGYTCIQSGASILITVFDCRHVHSGQVMNLLSVFQFKNRNNSVF
jgi:hypothetical protein